MVSKKVRKAKSNKQMGSVENLRRMATVIQDSNDAITFQDLEGNILAWNQGAEIIYGYSQAEALGMNIVDTVPTEYQEEARGFLASLKRGELVINLETKRKHKDGRIIDVWLTNTKLTDDKGKLTGIATTERDITQRKQSEASLREKFRELDYLREGQIALSESMRGEQIISRLGQSILSHLVPFTNAQVGAFYVATDESLELVSGFALPGDVKGKIIRFGEGLVGQVACDKRSLLIDDVPAGYFNKIESTLGGLAPRSLLICPILYEDTVTGIIELGSLHPFTEHQRAFLSHVSENIGIAINTSDVRKKVEVQNEALNKAQVLLEEKANEIQRASQYKTEFLANMSHELRTPLNSSLILAKLLMDNVKDNLTDEQIQYASSIYSSGNDLLNLINDILDLSKVEAGKLDIRAEKVVVSKVIDGLKQTFRSLAHEKNLILDVTMETDLPSSFITDRQRLDQILKNLVSNALKFTLVGSVSIRLYRRANNMIAFEVSDTGIGIPKNQHEIIFEAFRQADGTTNRKFGGTGLGLSISRNLAKLLGGSIEVESAAGKGSRFTLVLPEALDESQALVEQPTEALIRRDGINHKHSTAIVPLPFEDDRDRLDIGDRTILLIEDDAEFAKIVLDLAHEMKFKCIVGQSADEGFAMAVEYTPSAIVLDMKLPDHLGLTVLDRLKEDAKTRHIPVQVVSVIDYAKACLQLGAMGFLQKPVRHEELKSALKKLEAKFVQPKTRILIVGHKDLQRRTIALLVEDANTEVGLVGSAKEAVQALKALAYDCVIVDLTSSHFSGAEMLEIMARDKMPPIIVYTGALSSPEQESNLKLAAQSLVIKRARSPERLLDEVVLILHRDESKLSPAHRLIVKSVRNREQVFEGRKILLVDDDIRNIFALTSALEQKGATIVVGRNGHEALAKLDQDPQIDLVLMDIMMPEMDGYEATRQIRKQKRFARLPIIAVTAKAMKDDQEKCLEAGTDDYVSKPVDLTKLLSLIRVWIPARATL